MAVIETTAMALNEVFCGIEKLKIRISSARRKKLITLNVTTMKVPTLMPPAVLKEPPPINMSTMVNRVEASVMLPTLRLLKPEERGTVAWNQALTA